RDSPRVRQFVGGRADSPVAYRYPAQTSLQQDLLG
ncbi:phospholipid ABC transporter ATP-binding protein MlaF, partial [Klebsiella pneumoniae]|nr:phospholipid ABC transporter ATP-binding protein MlaF [Klebsiella pneumoniae]